ncbi:PAS domain-containing sensor histidine kinase [Haloterrigena salifodinae]|uniref:histidine kinase n=1 Tax=Haloterrigena salifodinae TaxID=2675099 RepID=A0A8T8DWC1_9EURY|nr:PAS domain-containing sensor histidine kinase [Haloterrigena salifodinae]QRV13888.1 PAS domain-containing sensor histidine kinase [Haloterrigena salifodinae]
MFTSARRTSTYVREYSVSIAGLGLLAIVAAYVVTFGGPVFLLVLEASVPTTIGLGHVWYGLRTRTDEETTRRADIVTVGSVTCGAMVALFCAWCIYLLSVRMDFSSGLSQPVISALSTGMAFGGLLGHTYVEFTHYYRESERLSRAVDASMDGIAVVVDDEHAYVNDAYASLYGVHDSATVEGTEWAERYTNAAQATIDREVRPALAERNYWRGTLIGQRADGTTFPQDVTVSALEHGYVVVARDITEQRDREQRIQVLNRVLRHNLRNAATVVKGHASLISEKQPALEREHVRPILEETTDLIETADKARGVERTLERNGDDDLIDATAAVRSVVDRARSAYPDARIASRTDESRARATTPTVDGSVVDALNELVDNAVEHNSAADEEGADGPTVEVAVRAVDYDGELRLEFTVADDGDGIPETERRAVLDGAETQLEHGSGLGLWLVNWIVQNGGGDLRFADRPDGGTVVTLSFPYECAAGPRPALMETL